MLWTEDEAGTIVKGYRPLMPGAEQLCNERSPRRGSFWQ